MLRVTDVNGEIYDLNPDHIVMLQWRRTGLNASEVNGAFIFLHGLEQRLILSETEAKRLIRGL